MSDRLGDVGLLHTGEMDEWNAFAANHDRATLFHSVRWKTVVETALGHRGYYLRLRDAHGHISGILPLFLIGSRFLGRALVALPFAGTQPSVCAADAHDEARLVDAAAKLAGELGAGYVELREDEAKPWDCPVRHSYVNVQLPLSSDAKTVWDERVESRVRTKVRAARKRGLTVTWNNTDDATIEAFYRLYLDTMRRLGSPPHSLGLFRSTAQMFETETKILLVMDGTEPVAGAFLMHDDRWVGFPWAASSTAARSKHPNNLLYWSIIEWACDKGYANLDLGRSPAGSGTAHFKTQWGGIARPLNYYFRMTGAGQPPRRDATDPLMLVASTVWRRLPAGLSTRLGPALARLVP